MSSTSFHKFQTLLKSFCDNIDCDWLRLVATGCDRLNKKFAEYDFLVNLSYKSAIFISKYRNFTEHPIEISNTFDMDSIFSF